MFKIVHEVSRFKKCILCIGITESDMPKEKLNNKLEISEKKTIRVNT